MSFIRDGHELPTVRIQKIVMDDFRSVKHGEVVFSCGKSFVPQDTSADILGIYGQNGSGKSSIIEAIGILSAAMSGAEIPPWYADCVRAGSPFAKLEFTFDFQYPDTNDIRTVLYSFKIETKNTKDKNRYKIPYAETMKRMLEKTVCIFDETVSVGGLFDGVQQKAQKIITSDSNKYPIGPVRKISAFVGQHKDKAREDLDYYKRAKREKSESFLFSEDTLSVFDKYSNYSEYYRILLELQFYAEYYLFAVDNRILFGQNSILLLYTRSEPLLFSLWSDSKLKEYEKHLMEMAIKQINIVLPSLIPELTIDYEVLGESEENGRKYYLIDLYSKRNNTRIPLRAESAGIVRMVSILTLMLSAFNDKSLTIAIDEFDAGIYEFLLGELLDIFRIYGKGQLIFTSHNLRPLEVLDKDSIVFTTTNPENRYARIKGVGSTNNLRRVYLNEVLNKDQDENMYDAEERPQLIKAFMKAGCGVYSDDDAQ
jgi:AAA15 family ATPase/GTPase